MATVMLLACFAAVPVMAQAPAPCAYQGDVTLDGLPCPGSMTTVELADGTPVGTIPDLVVVNTDSEYGVIVPQDFGTGLPAQGDTLNFYVDGLWAGTNTWEAGGIKDLDLAATTVAPVPPIVATLAATDITETSATMMGQLTDLGTAATVACHIEWGLTPDADNWISGPVNLNAPGTFWVNWGGATPDTTYYYKAVAVGNGTDVGDVMSFTTGGLCSDEPSTTEGFQTIADELSIVYYYSGFSVWDIYWPDYGIDTIEKLGVGKVYLIYVDSDCTLQYGTQSYELNGPDWNFIYWLGD